jgi:metal-responsive CopG/Arc/MetJ family transcriptional regulator
MPTSISVSPELLDRVDRAAQRRDMSRSQFISMILARAVEHEEDWPRFFFDHLVASARGVRTPTEE